MTTLEKRAADHYRRAYGLSRAGRKAEAADAYRQAIAHYTEAGRPEYVSLARIALCRCLTHMGDLAGAARILPSPDDLPVGYEGWYHAALAYLQEARQDLTGALTSCRLALPLLISDNPFFDDPEEWLEVATLAAEIMLQRGQDHIARRNLLPLIRKYVSDARHPLHGRLTALLALCAPLGGDGTRP